MTNIARPKHERAAIMDVRKALGGWHALDAERDWVQHMYDHASEETDCSKHHYGYGEADEASADLNEAQAEAGKVLAGAVLMLLRALGELSQDDDERNAP